MDITCIWYTCCQCIWYVTVIHWHIFLKAKKCIFASFYASLLNFCIFDLYKVVKRPSVGVLPHGVGGYLIGRTKRPFGGIIFFLILFSSSIVIISPFNSDWKWPLPILVSGKNTRVNLFHWFLKYLRSEILKVLLQWNSTSVYTSCTYSTYHLELALGTFICHFISACLVCHTS